MRRDARTIFQTLAHCLKLQCPVCGRDSIVRRPFNLKHHCDACGAIFKREEGFFVGAIMANVVATEVFILITYLVCLMLTNLGDSSSHDSVCDCDCLSAGVLSPRLGTVAGNGSSD